MKASSGRRALCLIAFSFCFYRLSHILPFKPGQSLIKVLELTLLVAGLLTRRGYCFGRSLAALTKRKFKLTHHRNSGHPRRITRSETISALSFQAFRETPHFSARSGPYHGIRNGWQIERSESQSRSVQYQVRRRHDVFNRIQHIQHNRDLSHTQTLFAFCTTKATPKIGHFPLGFTLPGCPAGETACPTSLLCQGW